MGFWSIQETPRQNLRGKKSVFVLFEIFFWRLVKNNTNTGNFAWRLRWKLLNSEGKLEDIRCRSQDWQKVYVSIAQIIWDKTKKAGQPHLSFSKYHKEDFQRMYFCICRRRKPVKKKNQLIFTNGISNTSNLFTFYNRKSWLCGCDKWKRLVYLVQLKSNVFPSK